MTRTVKPVANIFITLGAIDKYGVENINFASDFIAQYTARQEYRFSEISAKSQRTKGRSLSKPQRINFSTLTNLNVKSPMEKAILYASLSKQSRKIWSSFLIVSQPGLKDSATKCARF
jgi:hypothetical protein